MNSFPPRRAVRKVCKTLREKLYVARIALESHRLYGPRLVMALPDAAHAILFRSFSDTSREFISYVLAAPGWDVSTWQYNLAGQRFEFHYDGRLAPDLLPGFVSVRLYYDPLSDIEAEVKRLQTETERYRNAATVMEDALRAVTARSQHAAKKA